MHFVYRMISIIFSNFILQFQEMLCSPLLITFAYLHLYLNLLVCNGNIFRTYSLLICLTFIFLEEVSLNMKIDIEWLITVILTICILNKLKFLFHFLFHLMKWAFHLLSYYFWYNKSVSRIPVDMSVKHDILIDTWYHTFFPSMTSV